MRDNEAIALVTLFMTLAAIGITLIIARYMARRLRSREIVKAIEQGQPLPAEPVRRSRDFVSDLRTGILLTTFSVGFFLFLHLMDAREAVALALVPLFLGFGFLINSTIARTYRLGAPVERRGGTLDAPATAVDRPRGAATSGAVDADTAAGARAEADELHE